MTFLELILIILGITVTSIIIIFISYTVMDKAKRIKEKRLGAQLLNMDKKDMAVQLKDGWSSETQLSEKEVIEYGKQRDEHSRILSRIRQAEAKLRASGGGNEERDKLLPSSRESKDGGELQNGYVSFIGDPPSEHTSYTQRTGGDKQKARNPSPETIEF